MFEAMTNKVLELLKKLVALANHNPNEHESNAASRRVCLLLEENGFIDSTFTPPVSSKQYQPTQAEKDSFAREYERRAATQQQSWQQYQQHNSNIKYRMCDNCKYTFLYQSVLASKIFMAVKCPSCGFLNTIPVSSE